MVCSVLNLEGSKSRKEVKGKHEPTEDDWRRLFLSSIHFLVFVLDHLKTQTIWTRSCVFCVRIVLFQSRNFPSVIYLFKNCYFSLSLSPSQTIATLLSATCCVRLATLLRRVAKCCDMLGAVGSNLKMIKFFMQHLWMLHVVVVWPGSCNNVAPGHAH